MFRNANVSYLPANPLIQRTTATTRETDRRMSATKAPATITLLTFSEAGRVLDLDRQTLARLVKHLGITPRPVAWNGMAKGLSVEELSRIRRAWDRLRETA